MDVRGDSYDSYWFGTLVSLMGCEHHMAPVTPSPQTVDHLVHPIAEVHSKL